MGLDVRLPVDELTAALEPSGEVVHERDVCIDLVGLPLVHRDVVDGRRRASVVLEQQVLRHGVLLWCWSGYTLGRSRLRYLDIVAANLPPQP